MGRTTRSHRVTIADVAQEAGVSRTTVSHALNGMGKVNSKTRKRVEEVAARLNYKPSVRAQSLRSGRSQTLALLSSMPSAVSAGPSQLGFFTELAMGCARTALLEGYVFVLAPPDGDNNPVDRLDIDGAILLEPTDEDPLAVALSDLGIPFVAIDGPSGERSVDLHHAETAELLVQHLLDRGATRPGLIVGGSARGSQRAAWTQYLAASQRWGFPPLTAQVPEETGEDGGYRAARELLEANPDMDALFIPIDTFATGAVRAGREAGRSIGVDLLIATRYDGLRARTSIPPLTAVDLGLAEVSSEAVRRLVAILDGSRQESADDTGAMLASDDRFTQDTPLQATPSLVMRASTGLN